MLTKIDDLNADIQQNYQLVVYVSQLQLFDTIDTKKLKVNINNF